MDGSVLSHLSALQQSIQLHIQSTWNGEGNDELVQVPEESYSCVSFDPLLSKTSSALNPCFVGLVILITSAVFFTTGLYELLHSLIYKKSYGKIGFNSNPIDSMTVLVIFLNLSLFMSATLPTVLNKGLSILDVKVLAYLCSYIVMAFIILPLHIIEKSKTISQCFTTMFYWPLQIGYLVLLFIQGFVNKTVPESMVFVPDTGLIFVNILLSLLMFYIQTNQWYPNQEIIDYYESQGLDINPPNYISILTFSWMNGLIDKGYKKKGLENDDLPSPPNLVTTKYIAPKFISAWKKQLGRNPKKPSMIMALIQTFGVSVFIALMYDMMDSITSFIQPQLLKHLILFFGSQDGAPLIIGFSIAFSMFFISLIEAAFYNQNFIKTSEAGLGAKAALMNLVYDKAIKLSPDARLQRSTGDIVNHMSVDISRIQELTSYIQTLFSAPTRLVLCLFSLYSLLGNATWAGIVTMMIMMPINTFLVKSLRKYHKTQMKMKDQRTQLVSDMLQNVKSIKLYAWEKPTLERLREVRNNKELKNLQKIGSLSAVVQFAWTCVPFFVSCSTFAVFAFTSNTPLTPEIVFPALSLFDLLSDPIFAIPALMTALIECGVSLNRLTQFLLAPEVDPSLIKRLPKVDNANDVSLSIKNLDFMWVTPPNTKDKDYDEENEVTDSKVALKDINFVAKKGQLSCIVGRVGSGKSTFLQSALGELNCAPSDPTKPYGIVISGSIAYCSQIPWILNATVKENILFGAKYDEEFYNLTIKACELLPDIEILPDGDKTQVGEKGISLSGGQKARLSLARAVYSRADIYLLDDILSAVDAHVGKSLISNVLSNQGLLGTKTRILATNSITVLKEANEITLLKDQRISESGDMKTVMERKGDLFDLINEFGREEEGSSESAGSSSLASPEAGSVKDIFEDGTEAKNSVSTSSENTSDDSDDEIEKEGELVGIKPLGIPLEMAGEETMRFGGSLERTKSRVTLRRASMDSFKRRPIVYDNTRTAQKSEKKEKGKVKWSVYFEYAKACGLGGLFAVCFLMFLTVASSVAGNYWLKHWAEDNEKTGSNNNVLGYVLIYAFLGLGSGLITLVRAIILWAWVSIPGSKKLHDDMATAVMGAPMSFFETTPLGRVINRFSQDMSKIDSALPRAFVAVFGALVKTFFTLCIIGFNMPIVLLVIGLLSFVYVYYQRYYIVTSRDLKRIVSISKSPIFSHVQESLSGAETIRAYNQHDRFLFQHSANIDYNQTSAYCLRSVNRWLSTRLQLIGSLIVLTTSSCALFSLNTSHAMSPGLIGLVMSYALRVTSSLSFIVKRSVEIESDVVCCERIFEYCKLKQEEKPEFQNAVSPISTSPNWPYQGAVNFNQYTTKYRENLDPVLKNISIDVKPAEKVGIVGRTGAGKSTLALAIFRMIEPTSGHVEIDGVNTSEISLFNLRHNLSIIPQDSQVVSGTIRENLDPMNQYSDEQLWSALRLAHLKEFVENLNKKDDGENGNEEETHEAQPLISTRDNKNKDSGLYAEVAEGGSNLSVGQRQLMCLARALLNPSKVLVLDEATAAVDVQTDKIVQETIRSEFKDKTILTIAHRLDTIMDSDKILVLERGEVQEYDSPKNLLSNKDSLFYKLCENGGYLNK